MTAAFHLNLLISLILSRNLETALCSCIQPVLRKTTLEVDWKKLIITHIDLFVVCWTLLGTILVACSALVLTNTNVNVLVSISEAHVSSCKLLFEVWRDRSISLMRINNIFYFTGVHKNYSTGFPQILNERWVLKKYTPLLFWCRIRISLSLPKSFSTFS